MFLHLSVILFTEGCVSQHAMAGGCTPHADTPQEDTHSQADIPSRQTPSPRDGN